MLKKKAKRAKMNIGMVFIAFFLALFSQGTAAAADEADNLEIKPAYIFQNKSGRDPFEQRSKKEIAPAFKEVDITTFSLQGITTDNKGMKAALFKSRSGNPFGYIFIGDKLYGENDQVIPDVTGEIKSDKEVLLLQGDREVLFKLEEDVSGPNIRPGVK
jgi:hypothetical protein